MHLQNFEKKCILNVRLLDSTSYVISSPLSISPFIVSNLSSVPKGKHSIPSAILPITEHLTAASNHFLPSNYDSNRIHEGLLLTCRLILLHRLLFVGFSSGSQKQYYLSDPAHDFYSTVVEHKSKQ